MFIGEYHHNLDDKGRVAVPTKFRDDLVKGMIITKGLDSCLSLYTQDGWDKLLAEKLSALDFTKANDRAFQRFMLASAMDCQLDKQGRVILSEALRRHAKIEKKVVLVGLLKRVEIWDEAAWENYSAETDKTSNEIAEAIDSPII